MVCSSELLSRTRALGGFCQTKGRVDVVDGT